MMFLPRARASGEREHRISTLPPWLAKLFIHKQFKGLRDVHVWILCFYETRRDDYQVVQSTQPPSSLDLRNHFPPSTVLRLFLQTVFSKIVLAKGVLDVGP